MADHKDDSSGCVHCRARELDIREFGDWGRFHGELLAKEDPGLLGKYIRSYEHFLDRIDENFRSIPWYQMRCMVLGLKQAQEQITKGSATNG